MRATRAEAFTGYHDLKLVQVAKPIQADGRVFVRTTAAGVTPLDQTTPFIAMICAALRAVMHYMGAPYEPSPLPSWRSANSKCISESVHRKEIG
jgi:hypothetical protein